MQSLSDGLGALLGALPALIGALVILVIGFIIAKVLQGVVTKALEAMGFQGWMEQGGIAPSENVQTWRCNLADIASMSRMTYILRKNARDKPRERGKRANEGGRVSQSVNGGSSASSACWLTSFLIARPAMRRYQRYPMVSSL